MDIAWPERHSLRDAIQTQLEPFLRAFEVRAPILARSFPSYVFDGSDIKFSGRVSLLESEGSPIGLGRIARGRWLTSVDGPTSAARLLGMMKSYDSAPDLSRVRGALLRPIYFSSPMTGSYSLALKARGNWEPRWICVESGERQFQIVDGSGYLNYLRQKILERRTQREGLAVTRRDGGEPTN